MQPRNQARREQLYSRLRDLYENLGYTRFSMRRFEEYALYLENKSFLKSDSVLAFTNPDGKLMALKPDVTLSIVKHARRERQGVEKVYYKESVYRLSATANAISVSSVKDPAGSLPEIISRTSASNGLGGANSSGIPSASPQTAPTAHPRIRSCSISFMPPSPR